MLELYSLQKVLWCKAVSYTHLDVYKRQPISVEKLLDEPSVGVKGQSNLEIARTPRKAFRCRVGCHIIFEQRTVFLLELLALNDWLVSLLQLSMILSHADGERGCIEGFGQDTELSLIHI